MVIRNLNPRPQNLQLYQNIQPPSFQMLFISLTIGQHWNLVVYAELWWEHNNYLGPES